MISARKISDFNTKRTMIQIILLHESVTIKTHLVWPHSIFADQMTISCALRNVSFFFQGFCLCRDLQNMCITGRSLFCYSVVSEAWFFCFMHLFSINFQYCHAFSQPFSWLHSSKASKYVMWQHEAEIWSWVLIILCLPTIEFLGILQADRVLSVTCLNSQGRTLVTGFSVSKLNGLGDLRIRVLTAK